MISVQHMRLGVLPMVLLLATIMLTTIDVSQNSVLAQNSTAITPAPEEIGSNDDESSSSDGDDDDDDNNDSNGSSGSDDDGNGNDDSGSQDATSSEEEDETVDDSEYANPLLGEIRNRVSGALSASGMPFTHFWTISKW